MTPMELLGAVGLWIGACFALMLGWIVVGTFRDARQARKRTALECERHRQAALLELWDAMVVTNAVEVAREEFKRAEASRDETDAWVGEWEFRFYDLPAAPDGPGMAA